MHVNPTSEESSLQVSVRICSWCTKKIEGESDTKPDGRMYHKKCKVFFDGGARNFS